MKVKIQRWGNSLALRIPKAFATTVGLANDSLVDVTLVEGKVVVTPLAPAAPTLEELLAAVTDENRHEEYVTAPSIGQEVW